MVDPAEFACLKAIVLFRGNVKLSHETLLLLIFLSIFLKADAKGLKDAGQIENLQDQAQVRLFFPMV